ncbi:MAG: hypothetical protein QOJ39_3416 [Candidatus Eremiobacteraeota bacterium]|nr:hypothetical protein [Candidatus Eremiobacteraeota bacterium]
MTTAGTIEQHIKSAPPGAVFTTSEFLERESPAAVKTALSRLSKRGMIDRVRRGVYHKPRPSRLGRGTAPADIVAMLAAGGKAPGPAGPSAAAALGLSTQIPPKAKFAVVGSPPTSIPDVSFVERSNAERVVARLRPMEVALLEVLRDDLRWVEVPIADVRGRVRDLVAAGAIDPARLNLAAKREPRRVVTMLDGLLTG